MTDDAMFPGTDPIELPSVQPTRLKFDGPKGPLFKALAEARKHFLPLGAVSEADVQGVSKSGKAFSYKFSYAPLDVVLEALAPGLHAANLAILQPFDGDILYTIVACGDSSMTVELPLPTWTTPQELGSLLTYLRRYLLKGIFGVADSEDDDGNAASGNKAAVTRKEPTTSQPTGPSIPKPLADEVVAAAKANELKKADFDKVVFQQTGKTWQYCDEADAKKLLGVLKGGES